MTDFIDMNFEIWKDIQNFSPKYQVSNFGRVRSIPEYGPTIFDPPLILKQCYCGGDYPRVCLCKDNIRYSKRVAILVLETFIGPCPKGYECRHLDDEKWNSRLDNLCWGTRQENIEDKYRNGGITKGVDNGRAKLTDDIVRQIRKERRAGAKHKDLAERYGVAQSLISQICNKQLWKHVK